MVSISIIASYQAASGSIMLGISAPNSSGAMPSGLAYGYTGNGVAMIIVLIAVSILNVRNTENQETLSGFRFCVKRWIPSPGTPIIFVLILIFFFFFLP
jgi:hypothetical protein